MKQELKWLSEALAAKEIVQEMTHYRVGSGEIRATNGRLTAGHPWPYEGAFLVPGAELEKVVARMPGEPTLDLGEDTVTVKCGRFRGTIQILPAEDWSYPGVDDVEWRPLPTQLLSTLRAVRPFVSDNATQAWALCLALDHGWVYASNNIVVAGAPCDGVAEDMDALLPVWAADFVLARADGLTHWGWSEGFVAFRWASGAWMRAQLVVGTFPERAGEMVRAAWEAEPAQEVTDDFRAVFGRVGALAEGSVVFDGETVRGTYKRATVWEDCPCLVPEEGASVWNAKFLGAVLENATHWGPDSWPAPAPFKGPRLAGLIIGMHKE